MTKEEHLLNVIKENLARIDRIFNVIDFGKVCMSAELISDMNEFFMLSKNPFKDYKE